MEYNFRALEEKWQKAWRDDEVYKVTEDPKRPPFYVLDMFPYPSGAGLHVGHPLGYIASDIYARYKRLKGFNVLHPMGYDAFGLPAEQYAIQTGQHPAITTEINSARYREQLDKLGFSFDWSREFKTCDPSYYKWTQWVFTELFNSYYCYESGRALPIARLEAHLSEYGTRGLNVAEAEELDISPEAWTSMDEVQRSEVLMNYRLAYLGDTLVNWCPTLGTVLANDEVSEGLSVRGGYPVEQRKMRQWCLRISAYAERLLTGLEGLQWSESLKETQRNWIGRSEGAELIFRSEIGQSFVVFTTRPDTIYGVSFVVLAPESPLVEVFVTEGQREAVQTYLEGAKCKTERERLADRAVSGVFTGSYALNPITGDRVPIWISYYVLAGYGTGAIMAVPAHDSRDFAFAKHFGLPIIQVVLPQGEEQSDPEEWADAKGNKEGVMINSPLLDGLSVCDAVERIKSEIRERGIGRVKVNYRLRDAIFSRQRYWGEPFPVYYKDGIPQVLPMDQLPLRLPEVDKFLPTETGQPPLARATGWHTEEGYPYELSTMPGFAGSSAYYLRYMDPHNNDTLVDPAINRYWRTVDLYVGGAEHATGHLIYSRFWNKFLYDLGIITEDEPYRRLVNQGMIQGRSNFVYRVKGTNTFVSYNLIKDYDVQPLHVDVNIVTNDRLDMNAFRAWQSDFADAEFITESGEYICGWAVEKMSKSMHNVVNPDYIVERYGADTLRLYEMFLGPIEQSKPWDTKGIDGVHRFLRKLWNLYWKEEAIRVIDEAASPDELKSLHKLIKKVSQDIEQFSFNTSVSAFMICVNELTAFETKSLDILKPLVILLSPYAPHMAQELWSAMGLPGYVLDASWPECCEAYLEEDSVNYPVSFNGKTRFTISLGKDLGAKEVEERVLSTPEVERWLEGKTPKKVIVVLGRIVNIVV